MQQMAGADVFRYMQNLELKALVLEIRKDDRS